MLYVKIRCSMIANETNLHKRPNATATNNYKGHIIVQPSTHRKSLLICFINLIDIITTVTAPNVRLI